MRRASLVAILCLCAALWAPAAARAAGFGISGFDVAFTGAGGEEVTQAGAHPFAMSTSFQVDTEAREGGGVVLAEALKDLDVSQVAGFIGDPYAVPRCSAADFLTPHHNNETVPMPSCADSSAVGLVSVTTVTTGEVYEPLWSPVYDLAPPPGVAAELGFWTGGVPVTIEATVSPSHPYNVVAHVRNVSQVLEVIGTELILWGDPADPAHDPLRGICAGGKGPEAASFGKCAASIPKRPFLTLPRACAGPLATAYRADSWQHPGLFSATGEALTHDSADPPSPQGMTGCAKLGFGPHVQVTPGSSEAESAAGLQIQVENEDEGLANPAGIAGADIEATRFAFPAGMTLNPSAAEGLGVCSAAQFQAESLAAHGCPPASKLGRVEADTPILENHTLHGALYLAKPHENPFGTLLASYIVIRDTGLGVFAKLPVKITTDARSGQIVAEVREMPPIPLSRVSVALRQGPRAPFITPPACGAYATEATLTPTSGAPPQVTHPSFSVTTGPGGGPCPAALPFAPGFEAGTADNAAGAYAPFSLRFTRRDGEQDITRFSATLPPGVSGRIAGLTKCPDAAIEAARSRSGSAELAAPSCPASSRIGTVVAGAGVGTALTYVRGSVYLAGPYHGSPLSAAAIVPAVAGPFDVGTVVTRVGLDLDPHTAQVKIDGESSDPIPHILDGIPLKLRDLRVYADRPQLMLNATDCRPFQTTALISGSGQDPFDPADDTTVGAPARYQAAGCAALHFKPRLRVKLKGATRRGGHPSLRAVLTPRPGDANLARISTVLPHSEFIDPRRVANPCTRPQFAAEACPPSSVLGTATAYTPLLDHPLRGKVYFRSNGGAREVPDIVADVRGEGLRFVQVGFVDSVDRKNPSRTRVRTRFQSFPDAPVSKVVLKLKGGKQGLLENSANICAKRRRVAIEIRGQNGRRVKEAPTMGTSCKKHKKKRRRARHSRRR